MQIRRAQSHDAAGIAAVQVRSWQAAFPGLVPQHHLDALDPVREALLWTGRLTGPRQADAGVLVAETADGIVAFASYAPAAHTGIAEIGRLHSLPEVWGTGVGTRLLTAVIQELTATGPPGRSCGCWRAINGPAASTSPPAGAPTARSRWR
ncbi:GNAT family N-acetyltransferase [Streptomyces sp. NPDC052236]|uniref:GNAT family N-acetyltransferase n=1 Tax=Streptomyces sp. NPDC052236 TaxID=3365686 RepID=UPI0037D8CD57